jgi:hypothetical protein
MKSTQVYGFVLGVAMLGFLACSSSQEKRAEETKVTKEGVDIAKNPLGAMSAIAGMGAEMEKLQKELESMPATDPVPFAKLIEALPEAPAGWEASEPKGSTTTMGEFKASQASRSFTKGEQRVEVEIVDWNFKTSMYAPFFMTAAFSQEDTEGYNKGIKMGENPGREEYKYKEKAGNRMVILKKRYMAKVAIQDLPKEAFDEWWGKLKTASLP